MVQVLGESFFYTYTKRIFTEAEAQNSVYFMPAQNNTQENPTVTNEIKNEILRQGFPALKDVVLPTFTSASIGSYDNFANVVVCDDAYASCFSFVDEGQWFFDASPTSDRAEIIVAGERMSHIKIGDEFDLLLGINNGVNVTLPVIVIGIKNEPSYLPTFGAKSNDVGTESLFEQGHYGIFIQEDSLPAWWVQPQYASNMLIRFQEGSSAADREQVLTYLSEIGSYITYDQLVANSDRFIDYIFSQRLPIPIFMLVISTFSFISVAALAVNTKLKDYKIYFLCGCSRKRCMASVFGAVGLVGLLSGLINTLYVFLYPFLLRNGYMRYITTADMVMEKEMILYIFLYILFCITLSLLIPLSRIGRRTLIQIYGEKT